MRSERRHELQTNALADWLGTVIERVQPYQTSLLGVVLLAAMLAVGGAWWRYHAAARPPRRGKRCFPAIRTCG